MPKIILLFTLILVSFTSSFSQYLSTQPGIFVQRRYFINQQKVSKSAFIKELNTNKDSAFLYKESKKYRTISQVSSIGLFVLYSVFLTTDLTRNRNIALGTLAASFIISFNNIFIIDKSNSLFRQSIEVYNLTKFQENEQLIKIRL